MIDARRKLENERTFRGANEQIRTAQVELGVGERPLPFVCECYDTACRTVVLLTPSEYAEVRSGRESFFVAPGHEGDDRVLETRDRYAIVEKTGS